MFRIHCLQYSCTTVQYSFDRAFVPLLDGLVRRLGLVLKGDKLVGESIVARLERACPSEREFYISHQSGYGNYGHSRHEEEFVDYYKLLCLAKDLDAEINMSFSGTPRHSGFDYSLPASGEIGDNHWLFVHLTDNCNLNCRFCYNEKGGGIISFEDLKRFIPKYKKKCNERDEKYFFPGKREDRVRYGVTLGGGEPTLHPDFMPIVRYLRKEFDYVTVSSNGTRVRPLLDCGSFIDGLAVSYPFFYAPKLRRLGQASQRQVIRAFRELRVIPRRILSTIITSVMKPAHIPKILNFARRLKATGVAFLMFKPIGPYGEKYEYLLPGIWSAREIVAEISRQMISSQDLQICLDACSLAFTMPFSCDSRFCYLGPSGDRYPYRLYTTVCPWGERDGITMVCPFAKIYRAKLLRELSRQRRQRL